MEKINTKQASLLMIFILLREKEVRARESIVYQRCQQGNQEQIPSWQWKFTSSALVPPSPLTSSSSNKSREDA